MQFSPKGGNEMAQVSSDDAKRAKSAGKTRCQACVLLSTEGIYRISCIVQHAAEFFNTRDAPQSLISV